MRGKSKSAGSRNAGKRTGRRLGGYERRRRIKKRIDKKNGYLLPLRGAILQIKRKKAPFFIKKNDYKGMKIEINCTGSDTIQLHELTEFQGELKERSAGDVEKIIKSIKKHGLRYGIRPALLRRNQKTLDEMGGGKRRKRRFGGA